MTLQRNKPLARGTKPLKRSAPPRRRQPIQAKARKRPDPSSNPSRHAKQTDRDAVREEVFRRDGYRCRLGGVPGAGGCAGRLTFHHRRKAGQQGGYTVENGATLCTYHNDELEADADLALLARTMGLVLKRGDEWTVTHERFWAMVDRDGPVPDHAPELGPCWIWRGMNRGDKPADYGKFRTAAPSGGGSESVLAHRFALGCVEALVAGLEVDHRCRRLNCVHPRHLEQVTPVVNRQRQAAARPRPARCGKNLHAMTDENTIVLDTAQGTKRECRACKADRQAAYHLRKKKGTSDDQTGLRTRRESAKGQGATHETPSAAPTRTPSGRARAGTSGSAGGRRRIPARAGR